MLPTGQVLEDDGSSDIEIYTGNKKIYPGIAPEITKVSKTLTVGSTYTLSGKRLNGYPSELLWRRRHASDELSARQNNQ